MMIFGLLLTACTVPFSTSVGSDLEMGITLDQSCTGSGTSEEGPNTTSYTLSATGDICTLDITWAGQLVSQEVLDAEVEEALDGNPGNRANVTVTGATLSIDRIHLVDGEGTPVTISSFPTWNVALLLAGGDLYAASGTDVPELLASPVSLPLSDAQLALLNGAVQGTGTLGATGTATLSMPVSELPTTPTEMAIEFAADMDLDAEVGL